MLDARLGDIVKAKLDFGNFNHMVKQNINNSPKVLVIIPAYNEEENIVSTVDSIIEMNYDYVVINDGSTDATRQICEEHQFNMLDLSQNLGIGGAVQAGHKYAHRYGYDIDIQVDGDGQHDPSFIPELVAEIERGVDLVIGSRFIAETAGFKSTFLRRLGIKWLSLWLKILTGVDVKDPTSGFRASGRNAIRLFSENYPMDYPEPDSIATAIREGLLVREIPVEMRERGGGVSSISGFSSLYYMVKVTIAIWIASLHRHA